VSSSDLWVLSLLWEPCVDGCAVENDVYRVCAWCPCGSTLRLVADLGYVIPHCSYEAIDEGRDPYLQQLRQGTKAPALLELRIGAQVL
jgi:hypothetical protein